ncbi:MAG: DUF937 domain-containing protein [Pyrinomonadaceae bacterium]
MNIDQILHTALDSNTVSQMSQTLGADQGTTQNAIQAALPMLLGALANNSSTPDGASALLGALDRDHDGSVLDDVGGFLGNYAAGNGDGILGHVFGSRVEVVQEGISQSSGLDTGRISQLLIMLAPIVMGALGRANQQGAINQGNLSDVLTGATQQVGGNADTLGMLSQLIDANKDGSAIDDVMRMASGLFKK